MQSFHHRLFIIIPIDAFLLSHRKEIVLSAMKAGYHVTIVCKNTGYVEQIRALGADVIEMPIEPTGKNPIGEFKTFWFLLKLLRKERPDIVHNVGIKTILWGGLAAKLMRISAVVNAVCGLGVMFSSPNLPLYARLILRVMRFSNKRKRVAVIFQNHDDEALLLRYKAVSEKQCRYIKGSGINLSDFSYANPIPSDKVHAIFMGRMVKDKGVLVVIEAAELLREKYQHKLDFWLCGGLSDNPQALTEQEIQSKCDGEYIQWLGHRSDVKELLQQSHIVVFPSYYREGLPKSLIEASAIGRPIVTADSVGCRDAVVDGRNGFLVPILDAHAVAEKVEELLQNEDLRLTMGKYSRQLAERDYSVDKVVAAHLSIYAEVSHE